MTEKTMKLLEVQQGPSLWYFPESDLTPPFFNCSDSIHVESMSAAFIYLTWLLEL